MDDTTLRVEFPVGECKVIVGRPTEGQAFVLSMSRISDDSTREERERFVRRITRVMEELIGRSSWDSVIEEGLITGTIQALDLATLVRDVLTFDWSTGTLPLEGAPPAAPEPAPRPGPRVVSGG